MPKISIPLPDFFNQTQKRIICKRAISWFRSDEDREDFVQEMAALALEKWVQQGMKEWRGGMDVYRVDLLVHHARDRILRRQRNVSRTRGGEVPVTDNSEMLEALKRTHFQNWDEMMLYCVPKLETDRYAFRKYTFVVGSSGVRLGLYYHELKELTGLTPGGLNYNKKKRQDLVLLWFGQKLYRKYTEIMADHGCSEWHARSKAKRITLSWVFEDGSTSQPRESKKRSPKFSPDLIEEVLSLRRGGASYSEIVKRLGGQISQTAVYRLVQRSAVGGVV